MPDANRKVRIGPLDRRAVQAVVSRNAKQRMAESLDAAIRTMRR